MTNYIVVLTLATVIATYGVISGSTATAIGAMIIAPLMTPIMATTLAMVLGEGNRIGRSLLVVALSVLYVVGLAILLSSFVSPLVIGFETNPEITSRVSPNLLALLVALASGAAGAFAVSREDVGDTLPGVASNGIDEVEFFISTNPGEDLKPLAKVASGGEVSRIMLSLKSTLAKNDKLPLLIFDEIDVGVSGRIAQKVGKALKNLSEYHQVISITHLPQIASLAEHHFSIEKVTQNERVISSIKKLPNSERITEIARLLSGEKITEASLKSAREMIGQRE